MYFWHISPLPGQRFLARNAAQRTHAGAAHLAQRNHHLCRAHSRLISHSFSFSFPTMVTFACTLCTYPTLYYYVSQLAACSVHHAACSAHAHCHCHCRGRCTPHTRNHSHIAHCALGQIAHFVQVVRIIVHVLFHCLTVSLSHISHLKVQNLTSHILTSLSHLTCFTLHISHDMHA